MKLKSEEKSSHMTAIGLDFAIIQQAESDLHKLKVQSAPRIKDVVASFGPGPHKMPVPTGEVNESTGAPKLKDMIVNFRKDGETFAVSAVPVDSIT